MKNYILDTNVLLHDPNSLLRFKENTILIPIEVIEEIDRFKRESSELGQNARNVSRALDALRAKGHLNKGVKLENGGKLRIIFRDKAESVPSGLSNTVDSRIVQQALAVQKAEPKVPTILVTNQSTLSDGEDFTEGYRTLQLGQVVGVPTAGWIIFTGSQRLIDGSQVRVPGSRIQDTRGQNMEMHPRPVDVEVEQPLGETEADTDAQLQRAVDLLLKSTK